MNRTENGPKWHRYEKTRSKYRKINICRNRVEKITDKVNFQSGTNKNEHI